jgi:hypothetical protein
MADRRWAGKEFVELMTILSLDLMESYERIQTDPFYPPARRTWVRTFCSQLEAFVYSTKQMVAGVGEFPFVNLTEDDLAYLREVPRAGEKRPRFLPLKDNIKHMVATVSRGMKFSYTLDTGDGWAAMLTTIAIRDRLVHPKAAVDMMVTDDELKIVTRAQDWFHALTQDLWTKIDRSLKGLE